METTELESLHAFRDQVYRIFGCRRDALFEILDTVLTTGVIESPAHLSLAPGFQRHWGSIYDALNAGTLNLPVLEALLAQSTETAWYAVDASVWPRCDAETSLERGYYHHPTRYSNGQPIVAGWNYSWLVQIPERCSNWTAPMPVYQLRSGENVNLVAAAQIRALLRQRRASPAIPDGEVWPILFCEAGYDPVQLGLALAAEQDQVCLLVRLRAGWCFYADPPTTPTGGRRGRQGAKCACADPTTWPAPADEWTTTDPAYGRVRICAWSGLHAIPQQYAKRGTRQPKPIVRGTLLRLEVERLPHPTKKPEPLWRWWWEPFPPRLDEIWRVYVARFSIEHTFRFFKQTLKGTLPKLRSPEAADRWTWLLILAYFQLRLAQGVVADPRLPWQPPLAADKLTPSSVLDQPNAFQPSRSPLDRRLLPSFFLVFWLVTTCQLLPLGKKVS